MDYEVNIMFDAGNENKYTICIQLGEQATFSKCHIYICVW